MTDLQANVLYYGDNLEILRKYIPDASVDLIYLDPPFNSNRDYNVIFRDESGNRSDAQLLAFEDTWHWGPSAESTYRYLTNTAHHEGRVPDKVSTIIAALRSGIGSNQMMAYLVEMAVRLVELHRVLKPTGSLYLHCDPTASHYLKILLDAIFEPTNFRNEIIWRRTGSNNNAKRFGPIHQTVFYYAKSDATQFHQVLLPYTKAYVDEAFTQRDDRGLFQSVALTGPGTRTGESGKPWRGYDPTTVGRHWQPASYLYKKYKELTRKDLADWPLLERLDRLDEVGLIHRPTPKSVPRYRFYLDDAPGVPAQDIWAHQPGTRGAVHGADQEIDEDVSWLNVRDAERLGWPTQKPVGLLKRIIRASSEPGDVVLDPFCGCGTAVIAAQDLERRWIGIDITYLSIAVMKARLKDSFGIEAPIIGQPTEVEGARQLAQGDDGRYQFQWWALNLIDARPLGGSEKKGADRGIDGRLTFTIGPKGEMGQALVSVKSGKVNSAMVRDLKGTIEREKAEIGLFITLEDPTNEMELEATTAGFYTSPIDGRDYPRIQILTIRELLEEHKKPMLPLLILSPYQQAERIPSKRAAEQQELFGG
jgi:site-specific DNA-methyltransferase (adenine-specific)